MKHISNPSNYDGSRANFEGIIRLDENLSIEKSSCRTMNSVYMKAFDLVVS